MSEFYRCPACGLVNAGKPDTKGPDKGLCPNCSSQDPPVASKFVPMTEGQLDEYHEYHRRDQNLSAALADLVSEHQARCNACRGMGADGNPIPRDENGKLQHECRVIGYANMLQRRGTK